MTKLILPRFPPLYIISTGSFAGLLLIVFMTWLAMNQPWLGIEVKFEAGKSSLYVAAIAPGSPADNKLWVGDEITAFIYKETHLPVTPAYNLEDPDANPTYREFNQFMQQQTALYQLLLQDKITLRLKDRDVTLAPSKTRPFSSLPFISYWVVIILGFIALIIVLSIWSFRRGQLHIRLLAVLGVGYFFGAANNAVTLSREIVLHGELFYVLSSLNLLGIILFSFSITALLWNYPKKLSDFPVTKIIYTLYPVVWINQTWQIIELPLHTYYLHFLITFAFLVFFAIRQWYQSRNTLVDQTAINWLLLSITISLGITFALFYIPTVYSAQAYIPVSGAYIAAFMIFLGISLGIVKYRLFNLSRTWIEIWVWIIGGILLLLIDIALIYILEATSSVAFILSAMIVAWVYFPSRHWLAGKLFKNKSLTIEKYFPIIIQNLIDSATGKSMESKWQEILDEVFNPLDMMSVDTPTSEFEISNNGVNLSAPSLDSNSTIMLHYQDNGKKLFSNDELKLAISLYEIIKYTANIKRAHEEGTQLERERIARDLNEDIMPHLDDLIDNSVEHDVADKAKEIKHTLGETISSLDTSATVDIGTVIGNIEEFVTERIRLAKLQLEVDKSIDTGIPNLTPRQAINLQRIMQEAVSNIIRHARASKVQLNIKLSGPDLTISLCDNGIGVNNSNWVAGKGLNNIRKRTAEIDGEVNWIANDNISDKVNPGCCINFSFSLQEQG